LVNNLENELSTELTGDKVRFKRVIVDEFDAEEYLRHVTQLESKKDAMINELEVFKKEMDTMLQHKRDMQDVRMKEIEVAKAEREKANGQKKEN